MKAKLILSAIAVLAIVGGAMAFKATRGTGVFYYPTTTDVVVYNNVTYQICPAIPLYTTSSAGITTTVFRSTFRPTTTLPTLCTTSTTGIFTVDPS